MRLECECTKCAVSNWSQMSWGKKDETEGWERNANVKSSWPEASWHQRINTIRQRSSKLQLQERSIQTQGWTLLDSATLCCFFGIILGLQKPKTACLDSMSFVILILFSSSLDFEEENKRLTNAQCWLFKVMTCVQRSKAWSVSAVASINKTLCLSTCLS